MIAHLLVIKSLKSSNLWLPPHLLSPKAGSYCTDRFLAIGTSLLPSSCLAPSPKYSLLHFVEFVVWGSTRCQIVLVKPSARFAVASSLTLERFYGLLHIKRQVVAHASRVRTFAGDNKLRAESIQRTTGYTHLQSARFPQNSTMKCCNVSATSTARCAPRTGPVAPRAVSGRRRAPYQLCHLAHAYCALFLHHPR